MADELLAGTGAGEEIEMPDENAEVIENDDGSAEVVVEDAAAPEMMVQSHFSQLAGPNTEVPEADQHALAEDLLRAIEEDKRSREERDKLYADGLKKSGLEGDAPGGADFTGASRATHPMMVQATIEFSSKIIKEIFPANGPAKAKIFGKPTRDKESRAARKTEYLNWQMTVQMREFRAELEQTLTQVPMAGAGYMKFWFDHNLARPRVEFVPLDDIRLPYAATSFYTAQRRTHVMKMTALDYELRVAAGDYLPIPLGNAMVPENTEAGQVSEKIEGKTEPAFNQDEVRELFEIQVIREIIPGEGPAPYLVTIDSSTRMVVGLYRNWMPEDPRREAIDWIVELPFIPWRGAVPLGIYQVIGGLNVAATGALRAMLDSALVNTVPTLVTSKPDGTSGQVQDLTPSAINPIQSNALSDDIRKTVMNIPFNPPQPVLFQLLGFLVAAGKETVATTYDVAETQKDAPVGTTLALIEQGAAVFSAIHARMHNAMQQILHTMCKINALYLDDNGAGIEAGDVLVSRDDFAAEFDVIPVSDPRIFSDMQRYAQMQAVAQRATGNPLYDQRKVEERILEQLKIPDWESLLVPVPKPKPMNAMNENIGATVGKPLMAFPQQNQLAHIQTHLDYMLSPFFGMNSIIAPTFLPAMLEHLKQHIVFWYANEMYRTATEAIGRDLSDMMDEDDAVRGEIDVLLALTSQRVVPVAGEALTQLPPAIQQAQQLLQQLSPPPPGDPAQAMMADVQRKAQADQMKSQTDMAKLQAKQADDQAKFQLKIADLQEKARQAQADLRDKQAEMAMAAESERAKLAIQVREIEERQRALQFEERQEWQRFMVEIRAQERAAAAAERIDLADISARVAMNREDNRTAIEIAAAEIRSGEKVAVSTGGGINP